MPPAPSSRTIETTSRGCTTGLLNSLKEDKFPRALDMRDKLPDILRNQRARKILLDENEPEPFKEALAVADISGDTDAAFKRLQRFRNDLATSSDERPDQPSCCVATVQRVAPNTS